MPNPQQPPAWLAALPALFAIGAKMGGSTPAATGALQGADRANLLAEHQRQQMVQESQHQQQFELQQQAMQERQAQMAEQVELRRAQAIKSSIDDLRAGTWKSKKDYDDAVTANEQMLGQFYGVRPNMLRAAVPYNGPTVESRASGVMKTLTQQKNWQDIITSNGMVKFDRDEDGIEESVPVMELADLAKFPIARDPQSGQPMLPPKDVKAENVQEFDVAYQGVLAEYAAEGKDIKLPAVQGRAAIEARTRISKASKEGTVAGTPQPTGADGLKSYQRFLATEKLSKDWSTATAPAKEMRRQFNLMQTGLRRFKQGDMNGGSQAVLVTFQKILDPTSVVRESEYARSSAGLGLMSRLEGAVERLRSGGAGVPLPELASMVETARQFLDGVEAYASGTKRRLGAMASEYEIDPRLVFDDAGAPASSTAPKAGGVGVGSIQTLKSGKRVKVTKVNADGTYEGTVVR